MSDHDSIDVSVEPNEVLLRPDAIEVRAAAPLDVESARGGIALAAEHATVTLSRDGRTARLRAEGGLGPGPHTLLIEELVGTDGERLSDRLIVPFFVSDSSAKVNRRLRVESLVRLRAEELGMVRLPGSSRPEGPFVELIKATHRETSEPVELAYDQDGKRVNAAKLFADIRRNRERKYGKLHPTLHGVLEQAGDEDRVPVAVWLALPDERLPAKHEKRESKRPPREDRELTERIAEAGYKIAELLREHGAEEPRLDPRVPVVYGELAPAAVRRLQDRDEVGALFLHETRGEDDLTNSMAIAQSDTVQSSLAITGRGVNVAVYEDGPDSTTDLAITASFSASPATSQHSRHTHGIIKNTEANKPHGHARDCNLHSANTKGLDAIAWAARTRGCTVISQSFHRDAEQTDSGQSFDDMYKDWLVLHWPYPTILQAAGNGSSTEYVNHKGYNSFAIGSHNDSATAMAGDSVFRNPSSAHSDRELPELAANGTSVTAVGLTLGGTSMAAPAAAGCTALLQQASGTLKSWPEGCRAILLAGASNNVSGATWWSDRSAGTDASDGSGSLDALESVRITKNRRSRGAPGTRRGWDVGTLTSRDIGSNGETGFSYNVTVPRFFLGAKVKVALAWDSLATVTDLIFVQIATDTLQLDLDLKIYDSAGGLVGYSGSWDNSYEIAEFAAHRGETYTIKIRRWSGTADVWYGIAWTVQGTPLLRPDWDLFDRLSAQP
jgi:Subtilase family